MRSEDLVDATDYVVGVLRGAVAEDWSVPASGLDWDVSFTVAHIAGGITKGITYLASGATRWSPLVISKHSEAEPDNLLDGVEIAVSALAFVAAHIDPLQRAFHARGMDDSSGFLARGATEVLVHGWDVATALGLTLDPPQDVCRRVVARKYPWASDDLDPWTTLLTATGRLGGPAWEPIEVPLAEWDGVKPTTASPVGYESGGEPSLAAIAWTWDQDRAKWIPTYP